MAHGNAPFEQIERLLERLSSDWDRRYFSRRYLENTLNKSRCTCGPDERTARLVCAIAAKSSWLQGSPDDIARVKIDLRKQLVECSCQNVSLMEILEDNGLSFGPNTTQLYDNGYNLLHRAAAGRCTETVKFLLSLGWEPDHQARQHLKFEEKNPFLLCRFQGHWIQSVRNPTTNQLSVPDIPDHEFLVTPLLECFIQSSVPEGEWESGDAETAARNFVADVMETADVLLNAGADINCNGLSPLKFWLPADLGELNGDSHLKISIGLLKGFFERGGSPHWPLVERDIRSEVPLHLLTNYDWDKTKFSDDLLLEILRIIAEGGADLETPRHWWPKFPSLEDQETPLSKLVSLYLENVANSNSRHRRANEAHARRYYLRALMILVENGANVHAITRRGSGALQLANMLRRYELVDILSRQFSRPGYGI